MKTDEEVLRECVKIAVGNGWDIVSEAYDNEYIEKEGVVFSNFEGNEVEYDLAEYGNEVYICFRCSEEGRNESDTHPSEYSGTLEELLFSHSFCRKLFGEQKAITEEQYNKLDDLTAAIFYKGEGYENMECRWQHHIQKLALSTDRISYLRKWLNNSSKA